jgi:hypothetical protein
MAGHKTNKGVASGLATLGATGKLTTAQVPTALAAITAQAAAVTDLVVSVGTADGTVADVGASFNQTTLNNNFRDLADKVNALMASLRTAGILAP